MSRQEATKKNPAINLETAVNRAIRRYHKNHKVVSENRQKDISAIKVILSDSVLVDAQKHVAIAEYLKSLSVGLMGRSELRRHVLQALESVSLMGLMDDLLRRHKAEIQARETQLHSLQAPQATQTVRDLLLEHKTVDLNQLQETYDVLNKRAKKLSSIHGRLFDKYEALKKSYRALCKKHGEHCSFSSETLSQPSFIIEDYFLEEEPSTVTEETGEATVSSSFEVSGQRLFRKESGPIKVPLIKAEKEAKDIKDKKALASTL